MAFFHTLVACFVSTAFAATGKWSLVRIANESKVECVHLHQHMKYPFQPKYDKAYPKAEDCQWACLNMVPQCNAVNYSPKQVKHVKQGKCQFQFCEIGYKFGGTKHFDSYVYVDPNGAPVLPGTWIKARSADKEKVECEHLNAGKGEHPKYDSEYDQVEQCQAACVNEVPRCNSVNFSPQAIPNKVKFGKCQFQHCTTKYNIGGTKHFDSWMYNGKPLTAITTTATTIPGRTTATTTGLWTMVRDVNQEKLDCMHLHDGKDDTPSYDSFFATLELCQDACATKVPRCNTINYSPGTVGSRVDRGRCQFQFCDPRSPYRNFGTKYFRSYKYNGVPVPENRPSTSTATARRATDADYDREGWRQVGDVRDPDLECKKLNNGPDYDRKDGPKYGTKYPRDVSACKNACKNEVSGCDAINYHRGNGKCQFMQCNGKITNGRLRTFESFFLKIGTRTRPVETRTRPVETRTRPVSTAVATTSSKSTSSSSTKPTTKPTAKSNQTAVDVFGTKQPKVDNNYGPVVAIIVVSAVVVVGVIVGVIVALKLKKSSGMNENLM